MRKMLMTTPIALMILMLAAGGCQGGGQSGEDAVKESLEIMPGLTYVDSVVGEGAEVAMDDFVVVHYSGYLDSAGVKGSKFDSSLDRGEPIAFPLGRSFVIPGWEKGLPGMRVGGKRTLTIAPDLAYGAQGRPPVIPASSTLIFDIEMVELPSVEVEILSQGDGPAAEAGDNLKVHYTGWVWLDGEKGEEFDSSANVGQPYQFTLGAGMVIPGWDMGLEGMNQGTKAQLIIPSVMAYGKQGSGEKIPPNSTLCFEVELVEIVAK